MRPPRLATVVPIAALAWSAARSRTHAVGRGEERLFRAVNDAPNAIEPLVWPVMQMGSLAAVHVAAAERYRRVGRDDAITIAAVGTAVWGGIKLIKPLVGRGRPAGHLDRVRVRGKPQTGLGYPSGHAAVSMFLALAASTTPRTRGVALAGAAITAAGRMYVGAHLPLDIVGGAATGWLIGTATRRARRDSAFSCG